MNAITERISRLMFIGLVFLVVLSTISVAPTNFTQANNNVANRTILVSRHSDGTLANDSSYGSAISSNSQYVAFQSSATNLVSDDTNNQPDAFVHNLQTGDTELVSKNSAGILGNGLSGGSKLSADGRFAVFSSLANNLVANDTNGTWDVFIHDRQTGVTELISKSSDGVQGNSGSSFATISADGRFIAFDSSANNLVPDDPNSTHDLFLHDRTSSTTIRLSANSIGNPTLGAVYPAISGSGDYIVFRSDVNDLVPGDTNGTGDIFVYELQTGTIELVSKHTNGTVGNGFSDRPAISHDGRYVVFISEADNLVDGDTNGRRDAFWHDRQTGRTVRVSVNSNGVQGNDSVVDSRVSVSANGRYIAFTSLANNLVPGDTNNAPDVFIHDLATQTTELVSKHTDGTPGNAYSSGVYLSDDGRYAAFYSPSDNLVDNDTNNSVDVFVHEREISGQAYLAINYRTGASGSYFTLTGFGFPPNDTAHLTVNEITLGSIATDPHGGFTLILSTANANEGSYFVTATVNPSAMTTFIVAPNEPIRPQEGIASIFNVPAGIAFTETVFLPVVLRQ
jgi:hypothetical protein